MPNVLKCLGARGAWMFLDCPVVALVTKMAHVPEVAPKEARGSAFKPILGFLKYKWAIRAEVQ